MWSSVVASFQLWRPITTKRMLEIKQILQHVCNQACMCKSLCTMVHLCMWICACGVLLIYASCAWQSPWPLTMEMEQMPTDDWRTLGPGGLEELGPLSIIALIKPAFCSDWLATGFILSSVDQYKSHLWEWDDESGHIFFILWSIWSLMIKMQPRAKYCVSFYSLQICQTTLTSKLEECSSRRWEWLEKDVTHCGQQ